MKNLRCCETASFILALKKEVVVFICSSLNARIAPGRRCWGLAAPGDVSGQGLVQVRSFRAVREDGAWGDTPGYSP